MHHAAQILNHLVLVSAVFLALPILACADNATKVTFGIERALEQVADGQATCSSAWRYRIAIRSGVGSPV